MEGLFTNWQELIVLVVCLGACAYLLIRVRKTLTGKKDNGCDKCPK